MPRVTSIAATTPWGPERRHLAIIAAIIGLTSLLAFAGPAAARTQLDVADQGSNSSHVVTVEQREVSGHVRAAQDTSGYDAVSVQAREASPNLGGGIAERRERTPGYEGRWTGDHAAQLRALTDPSYGRVQPDWNFEAPSSVVADETAGTDVNAGSVVTAVTLIGLLAIVFIAMSRRQAPVA